MSPLINGIDEPWPDEMVVRAAGFGPQRIYFTPTKLISCGKIDDGVMMRFQGEAGGVLDWIDFEAVYLAGKKAREEAAAEPSAQDKAIAALDAGEEKKL